MLQPGCISLAQLSGAALVPISYDLSRKFTLRSWDAFMIPWLFARCTLRFGTPLAVPADASAEQVEQARQELETRLRELGNDQV